MIIKLSIGCVDGTRVDYKCFERKDALEFLLRHDHEGSVIDAEITLQSEEVYKLLEE